METPIEYDEITLHEEELNYLPDDVIENSLPLSFYGEATLVDFYRPGRGSCSSVAIRTRVNINLTVLDELKGILNVRYFTYDSLGNISDTSSTTIESQVLLRPSKPIVVNAQQSSDYFKFYYAHLNYQTANIKIYCHDKYTIRSNGKVCHKAFTSSTLKLSLQQISFVTSTNPQDFTIE